MFVKICSVWIGLHFRRAKRGFINLNLIITFHNSNAPMSNVFELICVEVLDFTWISVSSEERVYLNWGRLKSSRDPERYCSPPSWNIKTQEKLNLCRYPISNTMTWQKILANRNLVRLRPEEIGCQIFDKISWQCEFKMESRDHLADSSTTSRQILTYLYMVSSLYDEFVKRNKKQASLSLSL